MFESMEIIVWDYSLNENSMNHVTHDLDDNIKWIENPYANNKDVEFDDPLPDDRDYSYFINMYFVILT